MYVTGGIYYSSALAMFADLPRISLDEPQDQESFDPELVEFATLFRYPWKLHGRQAPEWLSTTYSNALSAIDVVVRKRNWNWYRWEDFSSSFARWVKERYDHYHAFEAGLTFDEFVDEWRAFEEAVNVAWRHNDWVRKYHKDPALTVNVWLNSFGDYMIARRWSTATPKELLAAYRGQMSLRLVYGPLRRAGWSHQSALQMSNLYARDVRTVKRLRRRGIPVRTLKRLSHVELRNLFVLLRKMRPNRRETREIVRLINGGDGTRYASYYRARFNGQPHRESMAFALAT